MGLSFFSLVEEGADEKYYTTNKFSSEKYSSDQKIERTFAMLTTVSLIAAKPDISCCIGFFLVTRQLHKNL